MKIPQKPQKFKEIFHVLIAEHSQHKAARHNFYYKINVRALRDLSLPLFFFYCRLVTLCNFKTRKGNVSKQFEYFGGHWTRSQIYRNLKKLERLGFIKPRNPGDREFQMIAGKHTLYINQSSLKLVRSRERAKAFKCVCFLLHNRKKLGKLSQRALIAAGFAAGDALRLARWIREHLTKKRLVHLLKGAMWFFRKRGAKQHYFRKGKYRIKISDNPATITRLLGNLTYNSFKRASSNGLKCSSHREAGVEIGHEPPDIAGRKRPAVIAAEIANPEHGRRYIDAGGGGENSAIEGDIRSILWDNLPETAKQHFYKWRLERANSPIDSQKQKKCPGTNHYH